MPVGGAFMPMFVFSHLPNIGKTIELGAIENRVERIDNGDECAY